MPPLTLVKNPEPARAAAARELDDAALARVQRGDESAFRALVLLYQARIFAVIGRTLGPDRAHRTEDLAQECLLRVFSSIKRFDPAGPARLSTWILTIATRLCLDELRRTRRPIEELKDDVAVPPISEGVAEGKALAHKLELALASLSPELRATFVLRVHGELSVAETAAALGVDEGTVKSRLSRARDRLRPLLEGVAP